MSLPWIHSPPLIQQALFDSVSSVNPNGLKNDEGTRLILRLKQLGDNNLGELAQAP